MGAPICRKNTDTMEDRRLFRSINMARTASRMPGGSDATFYDAGRAVALWVSAFEILAHDGRADLTRVLRLLARAQWNSSRLTPQDHVVRHRGHSLQTNIAGTIYEALYRARNDFLHGEPVTPATLRLTKCQRSALLFAAPLFRVALSAYLDLGSDENTVLSDAASYGPHIARRMNFDRHRRIAEDALLIADTEPEAT